jgi:hypothetical protein
MLGAVTGLALGLMEICGQHLAVSAHGSDGLLLTGAFIGGPVLLSAFAALPIGVVLLAFRRTRGVGARSLAVASIVLGVVGVCANLANDLRMRGFARLAERSAPLVSAIERYERDEGSPPRALSDLVPLFIEKVPGTGVRAYPTYDYAVGEEARSAYGDRWALSVFTPNAGINFDHLYYVPSQNYPEYGLGGVIERVGDWAYVHE